MTIMAKNNKIDAIVLIFYYFLVKDGFQDG